MSYSLNFDVKYKYNTLESGISIPISLSNGFEIVDLVAKIDTGADYCTFSREYAELLGIEVESEFSNAEWPTWLFCVGPP